MINFRKGNLLDADVEYICHQVNCQRRMGSGIAKSIRERWPVVYTEYQTKFDEMEEKLAEICGGWEVQLNVSDILVGDIQFVRVGDNKTVVNMFGQQYYGYDNKRYTSYDAFWSCLDKIREAVPVGATIGFPDHIGCGLGGANWEVILTMIEEALNDYNVYIYKLEV